MFPDLKHFKASEFEHPDEIDITLLAMLDGMRDEEGPREGIIITVNSDYRPGDVGWHGRGKALDIVIRNSITGDPLPVFKQFLIASRYLFGGIGFYPFWNSPGIHIDNRPRTLYKPTAVWWRDQNGAYRGLWEWKPLKGILT